MTVDMTSATTIAAASQPTAFADGESAGSSAAAQQLTDTCLSDAKLGRVGLEVEAHCYDLAARRSPRARSSVRWS